MDIFDVNFDNVKAEKVSAMRRYRLLGTMAKLLRLVEIFVALLVVSWISSHLPFLFRISGEYLRQLIAVIVSPLFIFLLCNLIVLTLLLKSGRNLSVDNAAADLYHKIVTDNEDFVTKTDPPVPEPEEIVYQDKHMILQLRGPEKATAPDETESVDFPDLKVYRRSKSDNLAEESCLRRSATEVGREFGEEGPATGDEDELSNEEFQRRIEGFIAKQVRFHQEEQLAIVLQNQIGS